MKKTLVPIKLLVALALIVIIYFAWSRLTSPYGDQKVDYEPAQKECVAGGSRNPWKYCIYTAPQGTNGGIAYYLHGRDLDENAWNDETYYTSQIQKYWADKTIKPPKVISISFGGTWLLTPKGPKEKNGLLDILTGEIIPSAESKTGKPSYRVLFGESMGGLNSLLAGLQTSGLFDRIAALCPPMYKGTPFDSLADNRSFIERTGADPKIIFGIIALSKQYVADVDAWKHLSPLLLLDGVNPKTAPEIYLSCGLYDKYGNFEGAEAFANKAKALGLKIQWRPMYGGHCVIDIGSVAEFITGDHRSGF